MHPALLQRPCYTLACIYACPNHPDGMWDPVHSHRGTVLWNQPEMLENCSSAEAASRGLSAQAACRIGSKRQNGLAKQPLEVLQHVQQSRFQVRSRQGKIM